MPPNLHRANRRYLSLTGIIPLLANQNAEGRDVIPSTSPRQGVKELIRLTLR